MHQRYQIRSCIVLDKVNVQHPMSTVILSIILSQLSYFPLIHFLLSFTNYFTRTLHTERFLLKCSTVFFFFKNLLYLIKNKELITQEYRTKVLFSPNTKVKMNNLGRRKFDPMFHQSKLFSVCLEAGGSLGRHHTAGFCLDSRLPSSSRARATFEQVWSFCVIQRNIHHSLYWILLTFYAGHQYKWSSFLHFTTICSKWWAHKHVSHSIYCVEL